MTFLCLFFVFGSIMHPPEALLSLFFWVAHLNVLRVTYRCSDSNNVMSYFTVVVKDTRGENHNWKPLPAVLLRLSWPPLSFSQASPSSPFT